jgi:PKD repeat protein
VTFDASGSSDPDGEIVEYRWDFDGDGATDRNTTGPRATHVFEEPGTYDVSLAVVDDTGVVGRTRASISVRHPFPPGTDLAVGGAVGLAGALTLRWIRRPSPAPSGVPDGGNSRVDGTDPGTTEEGERRRDRSPQAVMWYWPSEPVAPCPVVFDASLSTGGADGGTLSYLWKVDDESGSRRRWDVLFFDEAGDYDVELVVRDGNGTGRVERTVSVEEREGDLDLDEVSPRGTAAGAGTPDGEYVVFRNSGNGTLDLGGWTVHDVVDGSEEEWPEEGEHVFEFPDGVELDPGETATLHTGTEPAGGTGIDGPERSNHLFWGERRPLWNRETDVVVVEDDGALPVMAVRYRRGDDGDHEFEDLDVEILEDWFPTVVLSRREGVPVLRIGVGTGALLGAVSSAVGFLAGAALLRGPWTALRNWALLVEFLSMSSATWLVATTYGGLPASVDPQVAWLPPSASVGLLLAVAVVLRAGPTLRDRFGSRAG